MATATQAVKLDDKVTRFVSQTRKMLINGKWFEAASGKTFPTYIARGGSRFSRCAGVFFVVFPEHAGNQPRYLHR